MQRREVIKLLLGTVAVPLLPREVFALLRQVHSDLPATPALKTLNPHQDVTVTTIADLIIPQTDTPGAKAVATVRGNADLRTPVTFVRFEPFVLPKKSLTGDSTERVDTRVLQVIYRIDGQDVQLFVGQQMDVFIDASGETGG